MDTASVVLDNCIKNNRDFAVIMLDLDHFKKINDTHGHAIGDEVLKITVSRVKNVLKKDTLMARYGGEEFIILIADETKEDVLNIAWRIQKSLTADPFAIDDLSLAVTASLGIASRNNLKNLQEIINNSDKALYRAKDAGRNAVEYF
jgi:diguanylate cyclase (GGDEF)-like protein